MVETEQSVSTIFFSFKQDGYFRIRRFKSSNELRS